MIRDEALALALRDQIAFEVRANGVLDTSCHVTVCLADGRVLQRAAGIKVDMVRREWARMTAERMNRSDLAGGVRHGGAWVVAWVEPVSTIDRTPTRVLFLWKDEDGDTPVVFSCDRPLWEMIEWGPDWPLANAAEAMRRHHDREKALDIKPRDKIRAAQGERAYDPATGRPIDANRIVIDPLSAID